MKSSRVLFAFCLAVFIPTVLFSCKKDKYFDSDYIVQNNTDEAIEVYSSAYTKGTGGSYNLVSFTDEIAGHAWYTLRNIGAKEDADITGIFHEVIIRQNGIQCTKDELSNSNWVKKKVNDDKFSYTLTVDTVDFQ